MDALSPGGATRCRLEHEQAGGKGANAARALAALGEGATAPARALLRGFVGGPTGRLFLELAAAEGIQVAPTALDAGDTRVSTVVLEDDGRLTRLYERGPAITAADEARLLAAVAEPAARPDWALLAGAAPPDADAGFYAALCRTLRGAGHRVMIDATGEQLAGALAEEPDFVKVNLDEARSAVGGDLTGTLTTAGLAAAGLELSRRLIAAGAGAAVVTLGEAGAAGVIDGAEWYVRTPPVQAVNTVGSGDCFAAGLLLAFARALRTAESLALAAGAAAANAASRLTGTVDPTLARELAGGASAGPLDVR